MSPEFIYPGKELALFSNATHWKKYMSGFIKPYLKGRVLEVGAGLGAMNAWLNSTSVDEWIMIEPDKSMAVAIKKKIDDGRIQANSTVIIGTIDSVHNLLFDAILYIDVLEHIEDDRAEIAKAAMLLKQGGKLIILSPAFQFLYSPFDRAIGHFRRYSKKDLQNVTGNLLAKRVVRYLDTTGFIASLANKLLLKQQYPGQKQVNFWDSVLVPVSVRLDKLLGYAFGKSILGIWEKQ